MREIAVAAKIRDAWGIKHDTLAKKKLIRLIQEHLAFEPVLPHISNQLHDLIGRIHSD